MIYTHVPNRPGLAVRSPEDGYAEETRWAPRHLYQHGWREGTATGGKIDGL